MVNEINKIVYNLLMSDREVCIGGVGTLFVVRYAAYRTSRKSLMPPYRIVTFTAEERGVLLEEEIARTAGADAQKAHELFESWILAVVDGDTLKIEGVGSLRNDKFTAEESFLADLNPQGRAPIRLKPKANVGLYGFASLCMLFAVAVAGFLYVDNNDIELFGGRNDAVAEVAVDEVAKPIAQEVVPVVEQVDSAKVELPQAVQPEVAEPQVAQPQVVTESVASGEILSTVSGRSYVVLGVFSTPENADKAIRQACKRDGGVQCAVYHYGSKYMVALYDAPSRSECQEYARSLGDAFKDLWVYSRK